MTSQLSPSPPAARTPLRPVRRWVLGIGVVLSLVAILWGVLLMINLLGRTTETSTTTLRPVTPLLAVFAPGGKVTVTGADVQDVRITTRLTYGLRRPTVSQFSGPEGVTVDVSCGWWNVVCSTSYDVVVPRAFAVHAESSGGSIRVSEVTGRVEAHSSGGGITAVDVSGGVRADSSGGGITLDRIGGPVDLHSSGGGIAATGLRGGDTTADSSGGGIRLAFATPPTTVFAQSSGGGVEVRLPSVDGAYSVDASSSGGGRTVSVPTDPASTRHITARSSGGSVRVLPTTDG